MSTYPQLEQWQLRLRFPRRTFNALSRVALTRHERALLGEVERMLQQSLGYQPRWLALKVVTLLRVKGWRRGKR